MTKKTCDSKTKTKTKTKTNTKNKQCGVKHFVVPPFREMSGRKYDYPKNETQWKKECKKAITYQKKRWKAICESKSNNNVSVPPRDYYYESLLIKPKQVVKKKLRYEHREELKDQGKIPKKNSKDYHVHHIDGKFTSSKNTKVVHVDDHKEIHKHDIKKKRQSKYKNN